MNGGEEREELEFDSAWSLGWLTPADQEWHDIRAAGVSGSIIAPILGLSPYESAFSAWHRKAGLLGLGPRLPPVKVTEAMRWGNTMEPVIADHYALLHPEVRVVQVPMYGAGLQAWQIASPDRILVEPDGMRSVLEIKTSGRADVWRYGPPAYYRAQVMWYMDVLQLGRAVIAVLIGGNDYREYEVLYDRDEALSMRHIGEAFLRSVHGGEPPPVDGHSATYDAARALADGVEDAAVELSRGEAVEYAAVMASLNVAQKDASRVRAHVLGRIGTGRRAVFGEVTVATRSVREDGSTHGLKSGTELSRIVGAGG